MSFLRTQIETCAVKIALFANLTPFSIRVTFMMLSVIELAKVDFDVL